MAKNDGGPAFPRSASDISDGSEGMSVRDYFAGKALAGMLADSTIDLAMSDIADRAFRYADAMLAEREK